MGNAAHQRCSHRPGAPWELAQLAAEAARAARAAAAATGKEGSAGKAVGAARAAGQDSEEGRAARVGKAAKAAGSVAGRWRSAPPRQTCACSRLQVDEQGWVNNGAAVSFWKEGASVSCLVCQKSAAMAGAAQHPQMAWAPTALPANLERVVR